MTSDSSGWLAPLRSLDGRFEGLRKPGLWFVVVLGLGVVARAFLVIATEGTYDVDIWTRHAQGIVGKGLLGYYQDDGGNNFNHPPVVSYLIATLYRFSELTGLPFPSLLRLPFSLLDAATLMVLLRVLAAQPYRYLVASAFWLHPLVLINSSYHGNTDSAIAFALLSALYLFGRQRLFLAALVLGISTWIKLPSVVAMPAFAFAIAGWNERIRFGLVVGLVSLAGYLPALLIDAERVVESVFLYPGTMIRFRNGQTLWGPENWYRMLNLPSLAAWHLKYNSVICLLPVVFYSWLRTGWGSMRDLARTVALSYALFYGLTNYWSFQYFAWALPFWLLVDFRFAVVTSVAASVFVYGYYAWVCESLLLLGEWDFIGHTNWPLWIWIARNAAMATFLYFGVAALIQAGWQRLKVMRA